jgi:acetyl-CoA C-acetyltransferase
MIHPNTPVLVGAGEYSERIDDPDYRALSPVQLAVYAGKRALDDALNSGILASHVDTLATVRTFEDSDPRLAGLFGKSNNFPRSIAKHLEIQPETAIWEIAGGQSPQALAGEICGKIFAGKVGMGLLVGAEAISTTRYLAGKSRKPDWSEKVEGSVEDRGPGLEGIISNTMAQHHVLGAPSAYALFENARRGRLHMSKEHYRLEMARLFAPFTRVAANNPHTMSKAVYSAEELATVTEKNRMICDPYPLRMVARDQVNQSAALLFTSAAKARELGIAEDQWIYLHGYADLMERPPLERMDLSASPAAILSVRSALASAGVSLDEITCLDLYSCFPIAVFNICDGLHLATDNPRGLTVTGGMPFFGGAGSNYSMHAIAEMARKMRGKAGSFGLIGANGGMMSKYSAGVYSTQPADFTVCDSRPLQQKIDGLDTPKVTERADGIAMIETYTMVYKQGVPVTAIVVGRLKSTGERFMANQRPGDEETLQTMLSEDPMGMDIHTTCTAVGNRFTFG